MGSGTERWLGLGLTTNLADGGAPDPFALLDDDPDLFDFVEYSAPLDVEQARREAPRFADLEARRERTPALFHPVHLNLYGPELESESALRELDAHAAAVGSPWVGNDVGWWHCGGVPFPGYLYLPPPLSEDGLHDCALHARHVAARLSVPLLLENPAVIARRGPMHVLEFMARLHEATGLGLILDLGHLLSFQLAARLPMSASLEGFPLGAVREIHLAGGAVTRMAHRELYLDDHSQPVREELMALLAWVLPRCTGLRAVTFEGDGHPDAMARVTLLRLRELVPREQAGPVEGGGNAKAPPAPTPKAPDAGGAGAAGAGPALALALKTDPWAILKETHEGEGSDPLAARAELEYRLAVMAEQLDRSWPMSRALLLRNRAALEGFARSDELLGAFRGSPGGVDGAFSRYARRLLRERPDEGASAALAFEIWAHAALDRPGGAAPGAGRVGPAPGVRVATFSSDLSELWHAVRAVRRHGLGRAEISGPGALGGRAGRAGPGGAARAARAVAGGAAAGGRAAGGVAAGPDAGGGRWRGRARTRSSVRSSREETGSAPRPRARRSGWAWRVLGSAGICRRRWWWASPEGPRPGRRRWRGASLNRWPTTGWPSLTRTPTTRRWRT